MVKGLLDGTSTHSDFYNVFDNIVATNPQLNKTITEVRNETNLFLVKVLRFYSPRDMAYVEELGTKKRYYCHMTHEMLSYEVSFNCMCDGKAKQDSKYGSYIEPKSNIYGIVADVRFSGTTDKKCLLSCLNYDDNNQLKSNVRNGEIRLASGYSSISLTEERINLVTPNLFINGLPFDEPDLKNYFDKQQINTIKSDTDAQIDELVGNVNTQIEELDNKVSELTNMIYPVGSIYMSVTNTNPSLLFGGEWEQIKDKFLLSCGDTYANGSTGGSATVSLTQSQMPRHTHTQNSHSHKPSNTSLNFLVSDTNVAINGTARAFPSGSGSVHYVYASETGNGINEDSTTQSVVATNKYTGGSGTSESASNGASHENMPPFLAVYVWKRIG